MLLANLLARSAEYADLITRDVEAELGRQMLVEATIAAHLVAVAERARMSAGEINRHLRESAGSTVLDEIWITDPTGLAVYRTQEDMLLLAVAASAVLARRVTEPVLRLTGAAAAVESETCNPADLDDLARRGDELGELARVFQRMAEGVILRERRLRERHRGRRRHGHPVPRAATSSSEGGARSSRLRRPRFPVG